MEEHTLVELELTTIQSEIARYDNNGLKIKSWCGAITAAIIGFGYTQSSPSVIPLAIFSCLSFSLVEYTYRLFQYRFIKRSEELENLIKEGGLSSYTYSINRTATKPQTNELSAPIKHVQFWLFYLLWILASAGAWYVTYMKNENQWTRNLSAAVLRTTEGAPYIGCEIEEEDLSEIISLYRQHTGNSFIDLNNCRESRDGKHYHLTIVEPGLMDLSDIAHLENAAQIHVEGIGIGQILQGKSICHFLVLTSQSAQYLRNSILGKALPFSPHVTLGFYPTDIYGVEKGEKTVRIYLGHEPSKSNHTSAEESLALPSNLRGVGSE